MNEKGEFEIWLPGIDLAIGDVVVVGDVLLSAASFVDGWCGVAAGAVTQPFEIDLTGSTFGALRWEPGTETPAEPLDNVRRCLPNNRRRGSSVTAHSSGGQAFLYR